MFKPNLKIYIILLVIVLGILISLVWVYSLTKQPVQKKLPQTYPTPTLIRAFPTSKPSLNTAIINITPVFTGANEDIPESTLTSASQKQRLKKSLPINNTEFSIQYDYSSDLFIVTFTEPKTENKTVFENWLNQNYPALPMSKFLLK